MIGSQKWPPSSQSPNQQQQAVASQTPAPVTATTILHSFRPPIFSIFGTHRPPAAGGISFLKPQRPTRPPVFHRPPAVVHRPTISVFQPFARPTPAPVFQGQPQGQQQHPPFTQSTTLSVQQQSGSQSHGSTSTTTTTTTSRPAATLVPMKPHYPPSSSQQQGSSSNVVTSSVPLGSTQRPPVPTLKHGPCSFCAAQMIGAFTDCLSFVQLNVVHHHYFHKRKSWEERMQPLASGRGRSVSFVESKIMFD